MQIIGSLLRMAGGGEDRPLVVFQDFQPGRDIGGVFVAGLRRDAKIGAKVVSHGRYVAFQMAEVAIPKNLFADILRLIAELRPPPVTSTA